MSTSCSSSGSWAINVDKCVRGEYRPSIYKIPDHIAGENRKLYEPQLVSLGPYHYRLESDREGWPMFRDKKDATLYFRNQRSILCKVLRLQMAQHITSSYDDPNKFWGGPTLRAAPNLTNPSEVEKSDMEFIWKMIKDGCYILEVLRLYTTRHSINPENFRTTKTAMPVVKRDMLLLENQVPFWLLDFLLFSLDAGRDELLNYNVGDQTGCSDRLLDLIIKFYSLPESTRRIKPPYLHILDIYRRGLISQHFSGNKPTIEFGYARAREQTAHNFPAASQLYEAGIPFKRSLTGNLKDVSYHHGTFRVPPFVITKDTESTLANLMAFEKLHFGAGNAVTSYVFVLKCLIQNARDVSLLESRDIIQHTLRTDEDVVELFGVMGKDVVAPPHNMLDGLIIVSEQLRRRRFRKRLNIWRLDLLEKYFNTPWGALSVIAAILLLTLTIIQTVYTVLSYVNRNK